MMIIYMMLVCLCWICGCWNFFILDIWFDFLNIVYRLHTQKFQQQYPKRKKTSLQEQQLLWNWIGFKEKRKTEENLYTLNGIRWWYNSLLSHSIMMSALKPSVLVERRISLLHQKIKLDHDNKKKKCF